MAALGKEVTVVGRGLPGLVVQEDQEATRRHAPAGSERGEETEVRVTPGVAAVVPDLTMAVAVAVDLT